jgi:hypothetical protein
MLGLLWVVIAVSAVAQAASAEEPAAALPAPNDDAAVVGADLKDGMWELGPVVVREDGTMGRLKEWPSMTRHEQLAVLKVVQRRNSERRAKLHEQEEASAKRPEL